MGIDTESKECLEADNLIKLIFYALCVLKSNENPQLGARFLEECFYIDQFMHEEQLGLIQQYTTISHIKVGLTYLTKGISKCEKNFMNGNQNEDESSSASE